MRSRTLLAVVCLAFLLVPTSLADGGEQRTEHRFEGHIDAAIGGLPTNLLANNLAAGSHHVEIPADAEELRVTLAWNATAGDLDPVLTAPQACPPPGGGLLDEDECRGASRFTSFEGTPVLDELPEDGRFRNPDGQLGAPDSPARLTVGSEAIDRWQDCEGAACTWTISAWADGPVLGADYALELEILH